MSTIVVKLAGTAAALAVGTMAGKKAHKNDLLRVPFRGKPEDDISVKEDVRFGGGILLGLIGLLPGAVGTVAKSASDANFSSLMTTENISAGLREDATKEAEETATSSVTADSKKGG